MRDFTHFARTGRIFMPVEFAPHDGCLMIWPERGIPAVWSFGAGAGAFIQVMRTIAESES